MTNIILFVLKNNPAEQVLPKPVMENTAGMINLPKVTESYVADSRPVNSEGGNLELLWRIRPFINTHEIKISDPLLLGDSQGESSISK